MTQFSHYAMALAVAFLFTSAVWAQDDDAPMQEVSEEQQAMMEAWTNAMTPGDEHAWLGEMAGTWNVESTMWMEPGADPMVTEGTVEREMILGGRVLRETFSSTMMGQPFEGVAHMGYDNVTGTYWVTWIDNMSTALYTGEGECNEERTLCTFELSGPDPMTGEVMSFGAETEYGENEETHTHVEERGGEEVTTMEMVYTRAE